MSSKEGNARGRHFTLSKCDNRGLATFAGTMTMTVNDKVLVNCFQNLKSSTFVLHIVKYRYTLIPFSVFFVYPQINKREL